MCYLYLYGLVAIRLVDALSLWSIKLLPWTARPRVLNLLPSPKLLYIEKTCTGLVVAI